MQVADEPTYRLSEIVGTSNESIHQAVRNGIRRASRTIRNVDWFEVTQIRGTVVDGEVGQFQVAMKVGFRVEEWFLDQYWSRPGRHPPAWLMAPVCRSARGRVCPSPDYWSHVLAPVKQHIEDALGRGLPDIGLRATRKVGGPDSPDGIRQASLATAAGTLVPVESLRRIDEVLATLPAGRCQSICAGAVSKQ